MLQRPSKSKTWANDDDALKSAADNPPTGTQDADEASFEEPSSAQRKKAKVDEPVADSKPEPMVIDGTEKEDNPEPTEQKPSDPQPQEPVSDADWLRSKTSRLLGLLDEEEQAEFDAKAQENTDASKEAEAERDQTPVIQHTEGNGTDETEVDVNINLIRSSARLFVRNLPYDAKEADLESFFAPFGKIEEVSIFLFAFRVPLVAISNGCSNDDLPDRDIRCKAHDVYGKGVF